MSPRRRNREEERIHRAVADWLRAMGVYFTHVPNEEQNELQRQIKAGLGTLPGVADLLIFDPPPACRMMERDGPDGPIPTGPYTFRGACLEIKAPGKKPTPAQYAFLAEMDKRRWATHWSDDLDDALSWLRGLGYGLREKSTPPANRPAGSAKHPRTKRKGGASPHTQRRR